MTDKAKSEYEWFLGFTVLSEQKLLYFA